MFKKQFIDVIEWTDDTPGVLTFRYPMEDREIQNGARLTVRDTQAALFVNEGQIADQFKPGLYKLETRNLPVLTTLRNWDKAFQSPFKSDIYFFSTREQLDQRWGTPSAIVIKDKQFGPMRVRAHGVYSYKIKNPKVFHGKVSGTKEVFTTEELEGQLRAAILTHLASFLGGQELSFVEMAGNQIVFSATLKTALLEIFTGYGLSLETFYVQSVSLPEELQGHFDKMASMRMVGDLKNYAQFQAADSIAIAAKNEGGAAGTGVGLGVGMAMSQAMTGAATKGEDPMEMITKLHAMMKAGVISEAEFELKKAELLKKVT
jgi:membrane protease subunit (stomatin/prohibitin family)